MSKPKLSYSGEKQMLYKIYGLPKQQIDYDKEYGRRWDERRKAIRENVAAFLLGAGVVAIGMLYLNSVIGG